MSSTTVSPSPPAGPRLEAMDDTFHLREPVGARSQIAAWLEHAFCDRRGNISRPKLLLGVCISDVLLIVAAGVIAHVAGDPADRSMAAVLAVAVLMALTLVGVLKRNWSYSVHSLRSASSQIEKVSRSLLVTFLALAGAAYFLDWAPVAPAVALAWMLLSGALLLLQRAGLALLLERLTREGRLVRRTVIVGGGPLAEGLINALSTDKTRQIQILGVFDDRDDDRSQDVVGGVAKLGNFEQLTHFCRNAGVDLLIVTVPMSAEQRLLQILKRLFTLPVDVRISALNAKLKLNSRAYSYVGGVPMLALMDKPLSDWDLVIKSIEDRVLGLILLALAAPVMAVVAAAVRLESSGPILFRQKRYGFNNELIEVFKFRSMYADKTDHAANKLVTRDDPRVTRVGRFIRSTSLDELPQLINVVLGQMSLVGPRPHATGAKADSDFYQTVVDGYFSRHRMKPGVTGWAQINGWRGETDTHEKIQRRVEADLHYIDNWSVLLDLYILARTPFALMSRQNAY